MAASSGSENEAAKMIGAQLQSLLKIPPIKKDEQKTGETGGRRGSEKENRRSFGRGEAQSASNEDHVEPRDRFGRPFQALDKRGRGRGYANGPRRYGGPAPHPRDIQVSSNVPESREPEHQKNSSGGPQQAGRGQGGRPAPEVGNVKSGPAPITNSFDPKHNQNRKPGAPFASYEQPPRFSEDTSRVKPRDLIDPALRVLAKKPECPADIRENIDEFNDRRINANSKFLIIIKKHGIVLMTTKNPKFPRARYYCNCCNYHMDNLVATLNHIMQERHMCAEKSYYISKTVLQLPLEHSTEHVSYLTELLTKMSKQYGLNNTERMLRNDIVDRINAALREANLEYQATLFGSSLPGFGLRESNVNININIGKEMVPVPLDTSMEQPASPKTPVVTGSDFAEVSSKVLELLKSLPHVPEKSVKELYTTKCMAIQFEEEKSRSTCTVNFNNTSAVLTAQLFAEYEKLDERVKPLVTCFRYWANVCDIDNFERGFLPPHCYTIMVLNFLIRKKMILPNLHLLPRVNAEKLFSTAEEARRNWKSENTNNESLGELWLDLLSYYSREFDFRNWVVSITRLNTEDMGNGKYWTKKINVEDPITPKNNLARAMPSSKIGEYIIDRIKFTYAYFAIPRKPSGPLYCGIFHGSFIELSEVFRFVIEASKPTSSETLQQMVRQIQMGGRSECKSGESELNKKQEVRMATLHSGKQVPQMFVHHEDAIKMTNILFKREYYYDFKVENFTAGIAAPLICKCCGAEGHLKNNCPDEVIPPFTPVRYPNSITLGKLNRAIYEVYERDAVNRLDVNMRQRILDEVRALLVPHYPSICLTLFGSTFNGFGMHQSDIDICLTFNDIVVPPDQRGIKMVDVNQVLHNIVYAFKSSGKMSDVVSIPSAKVPIVKFKHTPSGCEGDVSLYNRLSVYNTELLKLYVDTDSRVARLGLFLKRLARLCDIGDASKGSLSSYSYILMLIHYLQHRPVPVLPVLQELEVPGSNCVDLVCDGHRVKYCKELVKILKTWGGHGKNKESVSQLWLGFLNYYVETFDVENHVVSISQFAPLTRVEKSWFTEGIAIEDPFDKSHNLGLGLSRRMSVHIIRTFQKFRLFFHRDTDGIRSDIDIVDYYLDARNVREGNPPVDRQCRLCYRIGHIMRNCPQNRNATTEDAENREDESRQSQVNAALEIAEEIRIDMPPKPTASTVEASDPGRNQIVFSTPITSPQKGNWSGASSISSISPRVPKVGPIHTPNGKDLASNRTTMTQKTLDAQQGKSVAEKEKLVKSLNLNQRLKIEEDTVLANPDGQPVKDVTFFEDVAGPNPEGDQLHAMLQKNQGVTFAFGPVQQQPMEMQGFDGMSQAEIMSNYPAPHGYMLPNGSSGVLHHMPMDQGGRQRLPTPYSVAPIGIPVGVVTPPPSSPWHTAQMGMPVRFQHMIPVQSMQFDGQGPAVTDGSMVSGAGPPPGFAPLPAATTSNLPPVGYSAPPFTTVPTPVNAHTVAPIGMGYQTPNHFASPIVTSAGGPPVYDFGNLVTLPTQMPQRGSMHPPPLSQNHVGLGQSFPQHFGAPMTSLAITPIHMESIPNGEPIHNNYVKATSVGGEVIYSTDYGAGAFIPNPSVTTYAHGLSLSQAHHGPVVSALQMQHSQHHPMQMQGGHHYHHVRPFMPMGAFPPGSPYGYPTAPMPQHHQQQIHQPQVSEHMIPTYGAEPFAPPIPYDVKYAK